jgi:hypothetical protein
MQYELWVVCGIAVAIGGLAIYADNRRLRRKDLDKVGWVPWPIITLFAWIIAAVAAAIAIKSR